MGTKLSFLPALPDYVNLFLKSFECRRCGKCCRTFDAVVLSEQDVKALPILAQHLVFKVKGGYILKAHPCTFNRDLQDHSCVIYNNRPMVCRHYPLRTEWCTDGLLHLGVDTECPAGVETLAAFEQRIISAVYVKEGIERANKPTIN